MLATFLVLSSIATADPDPTVHNGDSPNRYRDVTELFESDFLQLKLQGQLVRPAGSLTIARPSPRFVPLFQLRRDFDQEIEDSARMFGT